MYKNYNIKLTEQQMIDLERLTFMLFELKSISSNKKTKLVTEYLLTRVLASVEKSYKEQIKNN
jgi:hypothetical protein